MRYLMLSGGLALSLLIGVLLIVTPARAAATITVTTTSDAIANNDGCSLREAIIAANTDSAFSDCPAGSGADTIVFDSALPQPATIILTNSGAGEDSAATGDLDISGTLTISGTGMGFTIIDGDGADRVFEILGGARVTLLGITVRNGNPGISADGGGIAVDSTGVLTLTHGAVISNTALRGGGVAVWGALEAFDGAVNGNDGGGISNDGGLLTLTNVQIISNTGGYGVRNENQAPFTFSRGQVSGNQGGGIYNATSSATLSDISIVNNSGVGVYNTGGTSSHLTMHRCTVAGNTTTGSGGGISNGGVGAITDVYDTRINGNTAAVSGGGVFNNGIMNVNRSTIDHNQAKSGGGIEHFGGNLHLTNDTLSSNTASDNGGGLYNEASAILTNVTLNLNTTSDPGNGGNIFNDNAQLSIGNSIVAHSVAAGNCGTNGGFLNSLGHNLDDDNTCGFGATGDITSADPLLSPLQDNGGATQTHALLSGSPAIDKGDDTACPATDQRGVARPQGAACDIGAYEFGAAVTDLSINKDRQGAGTVVAGERITYTITITNAGPTTPVTATVVDTWSPIQAVIGAEAPGCAIDLRGGVITCTHSSLDLGSVQLPAPYVILTTSAAFSGTLTNTASVTPTGGVVDIAPANNVGAPVVVNVSSGARYIIQLPLFMR